MNRVPETATRILNFLMARLGILEKRYRQHRTRKKLHVRETIALGEKRFLAVVEFHHQELLVAATCNSITVLASGFQSDGQSTIGDNGLNKDCLQ